MLCTFALLLVPLVEPGTFEDNVSSHLEESVEFGDNCVIRFPLIFSYICGAKNGFRLFSKAVEERADLLRFVVTSKTRRDSVLLEAAFPPWPVVRVLEVELVRRLQPELGHGY